MDYVLILVALAFISTSQILQKVAAVNADKQTTGAHFLRRLAARKETWWAIITLGTGTLFWLTVLYRMEVSKAFPFLSLGTVLVLLASRYYLRERITATRWIGVVMIIIGIILLSRS
jgi:undecaprenyl phosphate-alpha-L-ara4N flippase subunit ArnE